MVVCIILYMVAVNIKIRQRGIKEQQLTCLLCRFSSPFPLFSFSFFLFTGACCSIGITFSGIVITIAITFTICGIDIICTYRRQGVRKYSTCGCAVYEDFDALMGYLITRRMRIARRGGRSGSGSGGRRSTRYYWSVYNSYCWNI